MRDSVRDTFDRATNSLPRAALVAYGLAILTAAYNLGQWLWPDPARESFGSHFIDAATTSGTWIAVGTGLALLQQIADRNAK